MFIFLWEKNVEKNMGKALDPTLILCFGSVTRQRRIQDRSIAPPPPSYAFIAVKLQCFQYVSIYMYFIYFLFSTGRQPAAVSIFFKRSWRGGHSEFRRRKSVLMLPLLGLWYLGWYPNPQESGGAWVAQILVWALGALIHYRPIS